MGQILKLLVFLVSAWVVFRLVKAWLGIRRRMPPKPAPERIAPMQRCAHCGLYLPRTEGTEVDGRFYCCAEHGRSGPRPG